MTPDPAVHPLAGRDPWDYSRSVVMEHARRAATYADMLSGVAEMRDDVSAVHVLSRLVFEVRQAAAAVKLLQEEHNRRASESLALPAI